MTTPTRDIVKALTTASSALEAGKADRARRALVYAVNRLGLKARVGRVSSNPAILALTLSACRTQLGLRKLEAQRQRDLFSSDPVRVEAAARMGAVREVR